MLLLDNHHPILIETLSSKLNGSDADSSVSIKFADFDGTTYRISTLQENKSMLTVSISLRCFQDLIKYGVHDVLKHVFGDLLLPAAEDGFDVSVQLDTAQISKDPERFATVMQSVPLLKRHAMSAPFLSAFTCQANKSPSSVYDLQFRDGETIYIQALADRVTVIFATQFKDETDCVFAKIFLQEFADARRLSSCMNAPALIYTARDPPLELRALSNVPMGEAVGYVTFVLFPQHFADDACKQATISRIHLFRDYLHYHIKCSKAYMHSRMRARVDTFLKVLNRAKPEVIGSADNKKTASGRTFVRKA